MGEAGSSSTIRVVIADDAASMRFLVQETLALSDLVEVVAEAEDGAQTLEQVRLHRPDVLLLDLSMPNGDGLRMLPRLRQASPETHIVVLSGFADDDAGDQARALGADGYVEKGVDPDALVRIVEDAAGAKGD